MISDRGLLFGATLYIRNFMTLNCCNTEGLYLSISVCVSVYSASANFSLEAIRGDIVDRKHKMTSLSPCRPM